MWTMDPRLALTSMELMRMAVETGATSVRAPLVGSMSRTEPMLVFTDIRLHPTLLSSSMSPSQSLSTPSHWSEAIPGFAVGSSSSQSPPSSTHPTSGQPVAVTAESPQPSPSVSS